MLCDFFQGVVRQFERKIFMSNHKEWNDFLGNLLSNALQKYKETNEYEYLQLHQKEIDMTLRDNLTVDQKEIVEDCLFDIGVAAERETEILYKQGMKDCVWLLKTLGVIA